MMAWSFKAWPKDFASLIPMFMEFVEQGDPIAEEMMAFEYEQLDQFAHWFKARGAKKNLLSLVGLVNACCRCSKNAMVIM